MPLVLLWVLLTLVEKRFRVVATLFASYDLHKRGHHKSWREDLEGDLGVMNDSGIKTPNRSVFLLVQITKILRRSPNPA